MEPDYLLIYFSINSTSFTDLTWPKPQWMKSLWSYYYSCERNLLIYINWKTG